MGWGATRFREEEVAWYPPTGTFSTYVIITAAGGGVYCPIVYPTPTAM